MGGDGASQSTPLNSLTDVLSLGCCAGPSEHLPLLCVFCFLSQTIAGGVLRYSKNARRQVLTRCLSAVVWA